MGGAPTKATRSFSRRRRPSSGSHGSTSTQGPSTAALMSTPFRSPETWARGQARAPDRPDSSPCTRAISRPLYARPRCVWSTAFGTPLEPDVNSTAAMSDWLRRGTAYAPSVREAVSPARAVRAHRGPTAPVRQHADGSEHPAAGKPLGREHDVRFHLIESCRPPPHAPSLRCSGAAIAPMRQHAQYNSSEAVQFGSCQATTWSRPNARTRASGSQRPRRVSRTARPLNRDPPSTTARCSPEGTSESSVPTSQAPPGLLPIARCLSARRSGAGCPDSSRAEPIAGASLT